MSQAEFGVFKEPPFLKGLIREPNIEADLIEQVFGIEFAGPKPAKYIINKNLYRLRLFYPSLTEQLELSNINLSLSCRIQKPPETPNGCTSVDLNSIFYWEDTPWPYSKSAVHENTHIFVIQYNPSIYSLLNAESDGQNNDLLFLRSRRDRQIKDCYGGFNEGIAYWMEKETQFRIKKYSSDQKSSEHKIFKEKIAGTAKKDSDIWYFHLIAQGYQFIQNSFTYLKDLGLTDMQVFKLIIAAPPSEYTHLGNSTSYWRNKKVTA